MHKNINRWRFNLKGKIFTWALTRNYSWIRIYRVMVRLENNTVKSSFEILYMKRKEEK